MDSDRRRIALYAAIVFMSSALLLVLEIVAARLIAPYVGVSLYTWSAVIGIVLAGLSIGNALGGVWADRRATDVAAGAVLLGAGLAALAIPWLLLWAARGLEAYALSILGTSRRFGTPRMLSSSMKWSFQFRHLYAYRSSPLKTGKPSRLDFFCLPVRKSSWSTPSIFRSVGTS